MTIVFGKVELGSQQENVDTLQATAKLFVAPFSANYLIDENSIWYTDGRLITEPGLYRGDG